MLMGLVTGPESLVGTGVIESVGDSQGHVGARLQICDPGGAAIVWEIALGLPVLQRFSCVERVTGIEPALSAWESDTDPPSTLRGPI